jgi:hypothetical protein
VGLTIACVLAAPARQQRLAAAEQAASPQRVDFVAVDASGQPVTDLAADQVSLRIDGKDRAIASLELVHFSTTGSLLPAPFTTNEAANVGREFVLVIDEESIRAGTENPLREALSAFGATLPARDRIGVFTVPRGTTSMAPTTDRSRFRASVAAIQGRANSSVSANDRRCHGRDVLSALTSIVSTSANPGGTTPVVLFSVALAGPTSGPANVGTSSECQLASNDFQRLGQAAEIARAQFFVVRPDEAEEATLTEGLTHITGTTGGQMLALGGGDDAAMVRVARDTSAYYGRTVHGGPVHQFGGTPPVIGLLGIDEADAVHVGQAGATHPQVRKLRETLALKEQHVGVVGFDGARIRMVR